MLNYFGFGLLIEDHLDSWYFSIRDRLLNILGIYILFIDRLSKGCYYLWDRYFWFNFLTSYRCYLDGWWSLCFWIILLWNICFCLVVIFYLGRKWRDWLRVCRINIWRIVFWKGFLNFIGLLKLILFMLLDRYK
jgi:hypothetical protein